MFGVGLGWVMLLLVIIILKNGSSFVVCSLCDVCGCCVEVVIVCGMLCVCSN